MSSQNSQHRSAALDGIRGIAILSVVLYHATKTLGHNFPPIQEVLDVGHTGWLGVEVFFALSGFLITRILLSSRHAPAGEYFGTFYYRRVLRIFPLYFGVLAIIWLIATLWPSLNAQGAARFLDQQWWFWLHAANMSREFHGPNVPALEFGSFELTHFWTLAVEEHFYFFWPLLVFTLRTRGLVVAALAMVATSFCLRSGLVHTDVAWLNALTATPMYLAGLAIGGLAAVWLQSRPADTITPVVRRGAVIFAALLVVTYTLTPDSARNDIFLTSVAMLAALTTACVALWVTTDPQAAPTRWLDNRVLVTYGKYSYGIYIFHYLMGPTTRGVELSTWPGGYTVGIVCYVGMYLLLPLLLAWLSYRYWEAPWLKLKDRRAYRTDTGPSVLPAAPA